jgi:hypothetical protein
VEHSHLNVRLKNFAVPVRHSLNLDRSFRLWKEENRNTHHPRETNRTPIDWQAMEARLEWSWVGAA